MGRFDNDEDQREEKSRYHTGYLGAVLATEENWKNIKLCDCDDLTK
jgi:hypothetical protein